MYFFNPKQQKNRYIHEHILYIPFYLNLKQMFRYIYHQKVRYIDELSNEATSDEISDKSKVIGELVNFPVFPIFTEKMTNLSNMHYIFSVHKILVSDWWMPMNQSENSITDPKKLL